MNSSAAAFAATSDVSFYCSFFAKHCVYSAIENLDLCRGEVMNWNSGAELLLKNHYIFAEFFYANA
jgi:hypothetical protein